MKMSNVRPDPKISTRFEVTHGNYLRLYKENVVMNAENGPTFNMDGSRRGDSPSSDSFGESFVEIFVRDAYRYVHAANDARFEMRRVG